MPQFLSRCVAWFRTRPADTKAVIVAFALLAAVLASPVLRWVTMLALIAVVIALIARAAQRTPVRNLVIATVVLLAAFFVFDALASAVYAPYRGGDQEAQREKTTQPEPAEEEPTVVVPEVSTPAPVEKEEPAPEPPPKPKPEPEPKPEPKPEPEAKPQNREDRFSRFDATATVSQVVDGDIIEIFPAIDGIEEVRLIGLDTPETKDPDEAVEPYGPEATAFATDELTGRRVGLEFDVERIDQYRRLLAYVYAGV